jgi:hypothetical protein
MRLSDAELRSRWNALDFDRQVDVLGTALGLAVVDLVREQGPDGLGQGASDVIAASAMRYLEPLWPVLGAKINDAAAPAIEKAKVVISQELQDKIPLLGIIVGVVSGAMVLFGIWLARRYV